MEDVLGDVNQLSYDDCVAEAHKALYRLTKILEEEHLPYAIIGAFALNEYGHKRVTVDVDLVMREADTGSVLKSASGRRSRSPRSRPRAW